MTHVTLFTMRAFRSSSQTYHPTVPLFIVVLCFLILFFIVAPHLFFVGVCVVILMVVLRDALCSTINASL